MVRTDNSLAICGSTTLLEQQDFKPQGLAPLWMFYPRVDGCWLLAADDWAVHPNLAV